MYARGTEALQVDVSAELNESLDTSIVSDVKLIRKAGRNKELLSEIRHMVQAVRHVRYETHLAKIAQCSGVYLSSSRLFRINLTDEAYSSFCASDIIIDHLSEEPDLASS
jgi:hypothetical protein